MSPKILLKNDKEIYDEAKKYMDIFSDVPYIFNLAWFVTETTKKF